MYRGKTIEELRKLLDSKETTKEELFDKANRLAHYFQEDYNSFVTIIDKPKFKERDTMISGIPYALKDNFSTSGILTTASSNILKDYVPVYDATVYKKLKSAGATLIGKTVLDELAMGGTGTTGHTGVVKNPWDKTRMIGGSSAGSASSVALGIVPFSIGSDTGDSVRKPAAFGGLVGFKPTYGRISRYGLFAFASSLDHVAMFTRCVKDAAIVTDILKGQDEYDMTTLKDDDKKYSDSLEEDIKGKKRIKHSKMYIDRKTAEMEELKFKTKRDNPLLVKFSIVASEYFEYMYKIKKESTVYSYEIIYKKNIEPYFKDFYINSINIQHITFWKSEMAKKGYKIAYLNNLINVLRGIFDYAMRNYGLESNVVAISGRFQETKEEVALF